LLGTYRETDPRIAEIDADTELSIPKTYRKSVRRFSIGLKINILTNEFER
jgi:hypothetical protein